MGRFDPRRTVRIDRRRLLTLLGLGVLVVLALVRLAGGRSALVTLSAVPPGAFALMLVVFYAGMAVRVWRWRVFLRSLGHRAGLWPLGQLLLAGYFLNTVVPARAGDVVRIFLLGRREGVPLEAATGTLVMERALDVIVILAGAAAAAYTVLPGLVPAAVVRVYGAALVADLLAVVLLVGAPRLEGHLRRLSSGRRYQAGLRLGLSFLAAMRRMAGDGPELMLALAQTAAIWTSEVAISGLALGALGVRLPAGQLAFMVLTVDLIGAIPLLPGGLGQVETAYLSLALFLGVARESAAIAILLHRAVTFWSVVFVGGAVALLTGTLTRLSQEGGDVMRET